VRVPHLPRSRASRTPGLPLHPSQRAPVPTLRIESASCSNRLAVAQLLLPNSLCYNRLSAPLLLCTCFCCTPTSTYLVLLIEPKQMSTPMLADAHLELGALQSAQKQFSLLCNNSFSLAIVAEALSHPIYREHKSSNHICARIKSRIYTTEPSRYHNIYHE
jgi:hypothetical protein